MNILLNLEFDGSRYYGFQMQKNKKTVQEEIQKAIQKLTGAEKVTLYGSGRLDRGVHAMDMPANFSTGFNLAPEKFAYALNNILPKDIQILKSSLTDDRFHARSCAKSKTYIYKMYMSDTAHPLLDRYHERITPRADVAKMQAACDNLTGTHDFKAFSSSGMSVLSTVRTVFNATLEKTGDFLSFEINGDGFLYNMVRIICGTLLYIGIGSLPETCIKTAFESKNRLHTGKVLPAKALFLKSVQY